MWTYKIEYDQIHQNKVFSKRKYAYASQNTNTLYVDSGLKYIAK